MVRSVLRTVVFAALFTAGLVGVWLAHSLGRTILGPLGGFLVAFVAVLMLGAIAYIVGAYLFMKARRPG
jgi:predicted membrane channel-forming protein YqfA (hemolysin III family)